MERVLKPDTILITGASGQVGSALVRRLTQEEPGAEIVAPGRGEMDLASADSVRAFLRKVRPGWIVSSGAYTAVDAAEADRETAWAVNAAAPAIMAEEAKATGAVLIHLSTDYVFPGTGERPWVETDATDPLNVYGATKLAGEEAIARSGAAHIILRTSWVYSATGKNFVTTMLRLLTTRTEPLRVVADQYGCPTSADDLAGVILRIMGLLKNQMPQSGLSLAAVAGSSSGIYHCCGAGETTWADFASAIRRYLRTQHRATAPDIVPVSSSEYPTPATRPMNSRLNCGKLQSTFGISMRNWNESLDEVLETIFATDFEFPGSR